MGRGKVRESTMFDLAEGPNLAYVMAGVGRAEWLGALVFPSASNRSMSRFPFSLLIGCIVPVWQRFISLWHGRLGRTLLIAASSDTLRRSFPPVGHRHVPSSADVPTHLRSRAPRVRFPGTTIPRHLKNYPHEIQRLQGFGPPLWARSSPLLAFAQRIPYSSSPASKKNVLGKSGRLFQACLEGPGRWRQPSVRRPGPSGLAPYPPTGSRRSDVSETVCRQSQLRR